MNHKVFFSGSSLPGHSMQLPNRVIYCFFAAIPVLAMIERFLEVVFQHFPMPSMTLSVILVQGSYLIVLYLGAHRCFRFLSALRPARANSLFFLLLILLFVAFVIIYPLADSGRLGFSSDRDEAIDVAVRQILSGNYPYACKVISGIHDGCPTTGNPIAPFPGALLLAGPFVLLGGSALQNFGWLIVFFITLRQHTENSRFPAIYLITLLVFSPVIVAEIFTGGDLLANSLAVTTAVALALRAASMKKWIIFGAMLGISLSWRAHFLLIVVPILVYHLKSKEVKKFFVTGIAACVSFAAVTLPFWIANPVGFSPIHIQQRFNDFMPLLPHADIIMVAIPVAVGIVLGLRAGNHGNLLIACAAVVTAPILLSVILNSINKGMLTFSFYGWYALSGTFLGTLGCFQSAHLAFPENKT